MTNTPTYDAVVIGAGPVGEEAASRLPKLGLQTALVERELVGAQLSMKIRWFGWAGVELKQGRAL